VFVSLVRRYDEMADRLNGHPEDTEALVNLQRYLNQASLFPPPFFFFIFYTYLLTYLLTYTISLKMKTSLTCVKNCGLKWATISFCFCNQGRLLHINDGANAPWKK